MIVFGFIAIGVITLFQLQKAAVEEHRTYEASIKDAILASANVETLRADACRKLHLIATAEDGAAEDEYG